MYVPCIAAAIQQTAKTRRDRLAAHAECGCRRCCRALDRIYEREAAAGVFDAAIAKQEAEAG